MTWWQIAILSWLSFGVGYSFKPLLRRFLSWRDINAMAHAIEDAKERVANGTADERDRDIAHFAGTEWTRQDIEDFKNRRMSKMLHAMDAAKDKP